MTQTEIFRTLLDEQDMSYEIQDFKTRRITYLEISLNGEPFEVEFNEPLGDTLEPRDFTITACNDITAEEAFDVLRAVMDQ